MDILEDPGGELTIDQVSSLAYDARFIPSQSESPNYGFTNNAYWVRLTLDNETRKADDWLLELDFANMHYVDLYTPLPDGRGFERETNRHPAACFHAGCHPSTNCFQPVRPNPGSANDLPAFRKRRLNGPGAHPEDDGCLPDPSQWQHLRSGLFFGILIGLLVYNLFLLLSLWDLNYLYFVIELAATFVLLPAMMVIWRSIYYPISIP